MNFFGIAIAACSLIVIGACHPLVIKTEYHTGTKLWWVFLIVGLACLGIALFIHNDIISAFMGIIGGSMLWSIRELFQQKKRVERGWFPKKPNKEG